ncbi:MAG: transcription termination factor Rho [Lachnospiraceae bacterium]|jgi:transcription termination factor Rho|nr:transcription termination factor Rho [Lachnospiraceae bacterium]
MTKDQYESLQLSALRDIAKRRGMKGVSALRKAGLIDAMMEQDRKEAIANMEARKAQRAEQSAEPAREEQARTGREQQPTKEERTERHAHTRAQRHPSGTAAARTARGRGTKREETKAPETESSEEKESGGRTQGKNRRPFRKQMQGRRDIQNGQETTPSQMNGTGRPQEAGAERTDRVVRRTESQARINEQQRQNNQTRANEPRRQDDPQRQDSQRRQDELARDDSQRRPEGPTRQNDMSLSGEPARQSDLSRQNEGIRQAEAPRQREYPVPAPRPNAVRGALRPDTPILHKDEINTELDSGQTAHGILEVMPDGYGFIRCANYLPGDNDVYVAPSQIRRFNLKTGDMVTGNIRVRTSSEKFSALLYVTSVNNLPPDEATKRYNFEDMTPIFPDERIRLEKPGASLAMRIMDLMCPIGKGQRGMIVSPPKAGKTTLLKEVAKSVKANHPEIHLIILLIDERPEEVTDIKEAIQGPNIEVIYSTFDETPEHHKRVSEMVIERARRLVEHRQDVMILLDSITRLTRAYNLTEPSSGRTLSGGLDPAALHMPKRFFGAARNMREGGSLTILATALIETGSKMDDVVYEEFKGTGNMEMVLDRRLSERRIFPAIDIQRSGTRRDDLLLTPEELESINMIRRAFNSMKADDAVDRVIDLFARTRSNGEFVQMVKKINWSFN